MKEKSENAVDAKRNAESTKLGKSSYSERISIAFKCLLMLRTLPLSIKQHISIHRKSSFY
ncbi:hypothetical protein T12_2605 [Trichinella patagoniensis]|uniref:Uncharacterized protein n=1 Tax=Trichinella patagoniensis TaxID=990121 RepID=A0A0V1A1A2_9BILA|nr:hypothetical protein T12_11733 [Trichinella patagoniensis]KRY23658.1 hypothetical protein T12_2605 [Trichinella patagoniensis]